jgi:hypothetical protein
MADEIEAARRSAAHVVVPGQPLLDGFSVGKGIIRHFVAMPLGAGYSVEEQLTARATWVGCSFQVYPLFAEGQLLRARTSSPIRRSF